MFQNRTKGEKDKHDKKNKRNKPVYGMNEEELKEFNDFIREVKNPKELIIAETELTIEELLKKYRKAGDFAQEHDIESKAATSHTSPIKGAVTKRDLRRDSLYSKLFNEKRPKTVFDYASIAGNVSKTLSAEEIKKQVIFEIKNLLGDGKRGNAADPIDNKFNLRILKNKLERIVEPDKQLDILENLYQIIIANKNYLYMNTSNIQYQHIGILKECYVETVRKNASNPKVRKKAESKNGVVDHNRSCLWSYVATSTNTRNTISKILTKTPIIQGNNHDNNTPKPGAS